MTPKLEATQSIKEEQPVEASTFGWFRLSGAGSVRRQSLCK